MPNKLSVFETNYGKLYLCITLFVIFIGFIIRLKNYHAPLLDAHYFRQTQTATVTRNFYYHGIDILHPKLDIFGIDKKQIIILEFPFYQVIVTLLAYLVNYSDSLGRLVSIFFGLAGGLALMGITDRLYHDKSLALITLIFFIFAPLNIYFQQTFMIESTVVALHLFALYAWILYCDKKSNLLYCTAILITVLASLQKSLYAPFLFIPIIILLKLKSQLNIKNIIGVAIGLLCLLIWQRYADITNIANGQSYFTSQNAGFRLWYIGDLSDRLSVTVWNERLTALLGNTTKIYLLAFIAGMLYAIKYYKKYIFLIVWVITMIAYYLILFRIQSHDYYFMIILPVMSIVASLGLYYLAQHITHFISQKNIKNIIFNSLISVYLMLFAMKGYLNSKPYFSLDINLLNDINIMKESVKENKPIIFIFDQYDWNSVYTYYLKRKGIVLGKKDLTKQTISNYQKQGYKYLIFYGVTVGENLNRVVNTLHRILNNSNIIIYKI